MCVHFLTIVNILLYSCSILKFSNHLADEMNGDTTMHSATAFIDGYNSSSSYFATPYSTTWHAHNALYLWRIEVLPVSSTLMTHETAHSVRCGAQATCDMARTTTEIYTCKESGRRFESMSGQKVRLGCRRLVTSVGYRLINLETGAEYITLG